MSPPSAARGCGLGRHLQVGNMTYASKCFTTKAICGDTVEILECLELGGCEAFAQNGKIIMLQAGSEHARMTCT